MSRLVRFPSVFNSGVNPNIHFLIPSTGPTGTIGSTGPTGANGSTGPTGPGFTGSETVQVVDVGTDPKWTGSTVMTNDNLAGTMERRYITLAAGGNGYIQYNFGPISTGYYNVKFHLNRASNQPSLTVSEVTTSTTLLTIPFTHLSNYLGIYETGIFRWLNPGDLIIRWAGTSTSTGNNFIIVVNNMQLLRYLH